MNLTDKEIDDFAMNLKRRLKGKVFTPATLKEAVMEAIEEVDKYPPIIHVERDPDDPNRLIVSGPGVKFLKV